MPQSGSALSLPEALGVVGVVLPDKNPLLSMVTLLGAGIANGNAVIMVPSQKYPLPTLAFIQVSVKMLNVLFSKTVRWKSLGEQILTFVRYVHICHSSFRSKRQKNATKI